MYVICLPGGNAVRKITLLASVCSAVQLQSPSRCPPSRVATSSAHAGKTLIRLVTLPTGAANLLIMHAPRSTLHAPRSRHAIHHNFAQRQPQRELGQLPELLLQMYIDNLFLSSRSALGTRREMGKMENGENLLHNLRAACNVRRLHSDLGLP